ncbi:hypothetical protein ZOSMA_57G00040 [Zostera marina]|uniref:Uncharacterized protein n=1 Tax=Zostera marina TaxID=29655 RepID=A0A0K9NV87_ZOSMR|nr:hypothetical protein ZOSMA_57G00040 [Zostera marina]
MLANLNNINLFVCGCISKHIFHGEIMLFDVCADTGLVDYRVTV